MAYNYKCGQFDDAFSAKRLGNWADNSRPSRILKSRRGICFRHRRPSVRDLRFNASEFIANDSGHLLTEAKRKICKKTNHWGYPVVSVWDELFQCCDGYSHKKDACNKELSPCLEDLPKYFRCRSPLVHCANSGTSILDNYNMKYALDLEFQRLQARSPPVIWIYGYHQKCIEDHRLRLAGILARKLHFVYINPERVLTVLAIRYLHYSPRKNSRAWYWSKNGKSGGFFSIFMELPTSLCDCPLSIQRIVVLLQNILSNQPIEAFNTRGILEIVKMLFVTFPCAKGFVLDGFPVTLSEGDEFERELWPVAAGIYFTSKQWKEYKHRGCELPLCRPHFFLRNNDYLESLVEIAADEFGETCLKIEETECLGDRDLDYIVTVIKNVIRKYAWAMSQEEIDFERDGCREEKPKQETCSESSTPCSTEEQDTSQPSTIPLVGTQESVPERRKEPEPEEEILEFSSVSEGTSSSSSPDSVHSVPSDLERVIFREIEEPGPPKPKPSTQGYYREYPELYSHTMPDSAGVETQFGAGLRHLYVADLLTEEQLPKVTEDTPLAGCLRVADPAKGEIELPYDDYTLFPDTKDVERDDVDLDEQAYVQKVLRLEQEKMAKDLADRAYRRRLSHATYVTEPASYAQTVHTLFPPEKRNFEEDTEFSHLKPRSGEKNVRYEDQLRDVFHPEEKSIAVEDAKTKKTYVPMEFWFDEPKQLLKYRRTKPAYTTVKEKKKKTIFDRVKDRWAKFRRYLKPVPKPRETISAIEKLHLWAQEHPSVSPHIRQSQLQRPSAKRRARKPKQEDDEFRYD